MKTTKENPVHPMDALIQNIKTDQQLLQEQNTLLEETKTNKREIIDRLKNYRKDMEVFWKYATDEQKQEIENIGFDFSEIEQKLNPVAQIALDILNDKQKLTNEKLYESYIKALPKSEVPKNYTGFNIQLRPLFNRQILLRTKGSDPKSSRTDIIILNQSKN